MIVKAHDNNEVYYIFVISISGMFLECLVFLTENFLAQLFLLTRQTDVAQLSHQAFRFIYLLSKVRGAKIIVRWFPHEVSDLEPVLQLLQKQDPTHRQVRV